MNTTSVLPYRHALCVILLVSSSDASIANYLHTIGVDLNDSRATTDVS